MTRAWHIAGGRKLNLGRRGLLMGILNVTPDSFSDGGQNTDVAVAVMAARAMVAEGADIIDVGGESTRPGAEPVSADEEAARVLPVIEALADEGLVISVDTYRASTARAALALGASIVNDVTGGLGHADMLDLVAETGAGFVAMHNSRPTFRPQRLADPVEDQLDFVAKLEDRLREAGVDASQVVFDPGIGFGKEAEENLDLLARLDELTSGAFPLLLGTSRKRFIGAATGREAAERDAGTAATTVLGRRAGAAIFRVHAIPANRDALLMTEAVLAAGEPT